MQIRRASILLIPFFLVGCVVNQTMALRADTSGSAAVSVSLEKFFIDYLQSLAETMGGKSNSGSRPVFDTDQIAISLSVQPELELVSIATPSAGELSLSIKHGPLNKTIVGNGTGTDVFSVRQNGAQTILAFHLDRRNFDALARLLPLYEAGKSLYLFPDPANPMTEAEYLDYLVWAFEGVAGNTDVKAVLKSSVVKVRVEIKGTLVSQVGGKASGNTVEFSIPVLRALTLEKPIDFSITFRP